MLGESEKNINEDRVSMDELKEIREIEVLEDELSVSISFSGGKEKLKIIETIKTAKRGNNPAKIAEAKRNASSKMVYRIKEFFLPKKGTKRKIEEVDTLENGDEQPRKKQNFAIGHDDELLDTYEQEKKIVSRQEEPETVGIPPIWEFIELLDINH